MSALARLEDVIEHPRRPSVGIVPLFILEAEPQLVALSEPLEGCKSQLWLLAHPESRHLRRIATVYQALVEGIAL